MGLMQSHLTNKLGCLSGFCLPVCWAVLITSTLHTGGEKNPRKRARCVLTSAVPARMNHL